MNPDGARRLVVLAPLPWERRALLRALPGVRRRRGGAVPTWSFMHARGEVLVLQVGMGQGAAAAAFARVLGTGERGPFVCLGCAGGLEPSLKAGTVVVAASVSHNGDEFLMDAYWRQQLEAAAACAGLITARGAVLSVAEPLLTTAAKAQRYRSSGALVVDMESGALAREAARAGVPLAVGRVVLDGAGTTIVAAPGVGEIPCDEAALRTVEAHLQRWLAQLLRGG